MSDDGKIATFMAVTGCTSEEDARWYLRNAGGNADAAVAEYLTVMDAVNEGSDSHRSSHPPPAPPSRHPSTSTAEPSTALPTSPNTGSLHPPARSMSPMRQGPTSSSDTTVNNNERTSTQGSTSSNVSGNSGRAYSGYPASSSSSQLLPGHQRGRPLGGGSGGLRNSTRTSLTWKEWAWSWWEAGVNTFWWLLGYPVSSGPRLSPKQEAQAVISRLQDILGHHSPVNPPRLINFASLHYPEALRRASTRGAIVLVYLHSDDHPATPSFVKHILSHPFLVNKFSSSSSSSSSSSHASSSSSHDDRGNIAWTSSISSRSGMTWLKQHGRALPPPPSGLSSNAPPPLICLCVPSPMSNLGNFLGNNGGSSPPHTATLAVRSMDAPPIPIAALLALDKAEEAKEKDADERKHVPVSSTPTSASSSSSSSSSTSLSTSPSSSSFSLAESKKQVNEYIDGLLARIMQAEDAAASEFALFGGLNDDVYGDDSGGASSRGRSGASVAGQASRILQQQDDEYEKALEEDRKARQREKEEQAKKDQEEKQQVIEAEEEKKYEEMKEKAFAIRIEALRKRRRDLKLPSQPGAGTVDVAIRFPNSSVRLSRTFDQNSLLHDVAEWVEIDETSTSELYEPPPDPRVHRKLVAERKAEGKQEPASYEKVVAQASRNQFTKDYVLALTFPRVEYSADNLSQTLAELGLKGRVLLSIERPAREGEGLLNAHTDYRLK